MYYAYFTYGEIEAQIPGIRYLLQSYRDSVTELGFVPWFGCFQLFTQISAQH